MLNIRGFRLTVLITTGRSKRDGKQKSGRSSSPLPRNPIKWVENIRMGIFARPEQVVVETKTARLRSSYISYIINHITSSRRRYLNESLIINPGREGCHNA